MRAIVTAVVAAIEGCVAAIAAIVVIAIPAVVLWVVTFGIAAEQETVAEAVAGVWLLAHFVPMQFVLSQETMLTFGVEADPLTFMISLAPLSITLISVLFAVRAGGRLQRSGGRGAFGLVGGGAGFALISYAAVHVAGSYNPWPPAIAVLVATLVYLGPATLTFIITAASSGAPWWGYCVREIQRAVQYFGVAGVAVLPARAAVVFRLAASSLALLLGVSAVALAVTLTTSFADVIAIAQGLQLDIVGSVLLFLAQLFVLPLGVVWALAWLSGAGFTAGGLFSPFTEAAATLPSLPILGALPEGSSAWGAVAPLLVVMVHVGLGILFGRRAELRRTSWPAALTLPVLAAIVTGLAVAALCALASGSLGPGLLADMGPELWLTAGLAAAEAAVGMLLGVSAARWDSSRLPQTASLPEPLARWTSARARSAGPEFVEANDSGTSFADAETLDLSRVRDDTAGAPAPVIDLFDEVLQERRGSARDYPYAEDDADNADAFEAAHDGADDRVASTHAGAELGDYDDLEYAEEPGSEGTPEVFDIESVVTGDLTESLAKAPPGLGSDEESDELLRAFAWDAADSATEHLRAGDETKSTFKFGLPNWRGPKKKG